MTIRRILETLAQHDYRLTWQRWAVAAGVVLNQDRLLTAEELYSLLKKDYPDIGLATVYRTLDLLVELGLVDRVQVGDGPTKYGLRKTDVEVRQQLVCESCGEVTPLDSKELEPLCTHLAHASGYQISEVEIRVIGICPRCKAAASVAVEPARDENAGGHQETAARPGDQRRQAGGPS